MRGIHLRSGRAMALAVVVSAIAAAPARAAEPRETGRTLPVRVVEVDRDPGFH